MSNEQNNNQNAEILDTLKLVLTEVKTISVDLQIVKTTVDVLKTDMQDVKLRTSSMENHLVYFGTRLQNLEETVAQRLHDTRPIWQSVLERLDRIEKSLEVLKADVEALKADVATLKQTETELKKDLQEFKDTVLEGFVGVQKDINFYHRKSQMDVISFAKDLALLETRLERVESKLEIKN